ncbi:hypothetical protein EDD90_2754 [Streptomyces sp. Ag109_O5-1]|uniref:hypothetical protein n=1 Tax=Streptomyces sp. Ag109_O5-1 TaxID=1938851 RepID=UPI000F4EA1AD|nr:hypothetical protein [Streptomyces sp. Ag109_O5-1]RPE39737.1 hypothetical protein EDD90_2754 [Streptomyces sp. Ag109_O5-1]
MATSVTTSLPIWMAGCTYDGSGGNDLRNSHIGAVFYDQGIVSGSAVGTLGGVIGGAGLAVSAGTALTVTVQPGHFVTPNTNSPTSGAYTSTLVATATLTVQTADSANPRIDLVYAQVVDNGNSTSYGQVAIATGTPASSPTVPTLPANAIPLAQITVAANVTAVTSGMISDKRPFTAATGGIIRAAKGTVAGYTGMVCYDPVSGSFYHNNNTSSSTQLHVLPWQPVISKKTSSVMIPYLDETSVITATITTDGYTDIEVFFKCPAVYSASHSSIEQRHEWRMYIDNNVVDTIYGAKLEADGSWQCGVSWSYYTSSATADTPSAGTHTVKITVQDTQGDTGYYVAASTASNIVLRVEPVQK